MIPPIVLDDVKSLLTPPPKLGPEIKRPPILAGAALLIFPFGVTKNVIGPVLGKYKYEFDRITPPTAFDDDPALLTVPFDRTTPPIELDTLPGVEIAPAAVMLV